MKFFCPIDGLVELSRGFEPRDVKNLKLNFSEVCPLCQTRLVIKGIFDFDITGVPMPVDPSLAGEIAPDHKPAIRA